MFGVSKNTGGGGRLHRMMEEKEGSNPGGEKAGGEGDDRRGGGAAGGGWLRRRRELNAACSKQGFRERAGVWNSKKDRDGTLKKKNRHFTLFEMKTEKVYVT